MKFRVTTVGIYLHKKKQQQKTKPKNFDSGKNFHMSATRNWLLN